MILECPASQTEIKCAPLCSASQHITITLSSVNEYLYHNSSTCAKLHIILRSAAFHHFGLINIGKTSTAGRRGDPAPHTRIISRPQREHEPTALIHRNAASRDLQHQLLHVHRPAVAPKNRQSGTRVHASALYVHARPLAVTSRLSFHILSNTIFSPDAGNAALCSGPVSNCGPRHESHAFGQVRQKRGSLCHFYCVIMKASAIYLFLSFISDPSIFSASGNDLSIVSDIQLSLVSLASCHLCSLPGSLFLICFHLFSIRSSLVSSQSRVLI